ncbi:hypothetical protein [Paenibacillus puerhi]|uniref:hypothetical protein n=1 Tax=Paenibacillus puerhi TaxID=2692622 RepID=UPI001358E062|nr:hypothetical protein [Paenibacillus puerhi]
MRKWRAFKMQLIHTERAASLVVIGAVHILQFVDMPLPWLAGANIAWQLSELRG